MCGYSFKTVDRKFVLLKQLKKAMSFNNFLELWIILFLVTLILNCFKLISLEITISYTGLHAPQARGQTPSQEVRYPPFNAQRGHRRHPLLQGEGDQRCPHEYQPGESLDFTWIQYSNNVIYFITTDLSPYVLDVLKLHNPFVQISSTSQ